MFNRKGFTLIELMIVVVIMGILAAIAIPNFISMQNRAMEAQVKDACHTVQMAVEDYAVRNNGNYPDMVEQIKVLLPGGEWLENAFTGAMTEPQDGEAKAPGQVGYKLLCRPGGAQVGYEITGYGTDDTVGNNGIIATLSNKR